ncbi:hypothetical protein E2C01_075369 [Portunus trituberculatus]|uniref:Uncharacterized protein n=1 Tax=Portunus trituberculatus TaxID=210409 RepID=A0A5B7IGW7_PORTR|nr:hypothetical protein [Portunus trituberculatus]
MSGSCFPPTICVRLTSLLRRPLETPAVYVALTFLAFVDLKVNSLPADPEGVLSELLETLHCCPPHMPSGDGPPGSLGAAILTAQEEATVALRWT